MLEQKRSHLLFIFGLAAILVLFGVIAYSSISPGAFTNNAKASSGSSYCDIGCNALGSDAPPDCVNGCNSVLSGTETKVVFCGQITDSTKQQECLNLINNSDAKTKYCQNKCGKYPDISNLLNDKGVQCVAFCKQAINNVSTCSQRCNQLFSGDTKKINECKYACSAFNQGFGNGNGNNQPGTYTCGHGGPCPNPT